MKQAVNKRFVLLAMLTLVVAVGFWSTSRYPDLTIKGAAAPNLVLDGLGFDVVTPVHPNDPFYLKVAKRTVNWLDTNKKGMAFGLVIAAALGTALSALTRKSFPGLLGNTMLGLAIGAPMGLCVNCAAPIGAGLHRSGSRLETSMATVVASPTLNFVVLSILFTMLPWHLAATKVFFTVLLLFVGIPLLARRLEGEQPRLEGCDPCELEPTHPARETWAGAVVWSGRRLLRNLWSLSVALVPLMILAGALGSLMISLFPFGALAGLSKTVNPLSLLVVAVVGTFLPVPMAFDVIICGLLYHSGMPVAYVMTLLFTLGSFSVYSFAVFQKEVSGRAAVGLALLVCLAGWAAGYLGDLADDLYRDSVDRRLQNTLREELPKDRGPHLEVVLPPGRPLAQLKLGKPEWETVFESQTYLLQRVPFQNRVGEDESFQQLDSKALGLETVSVLSYGEQLSIPMLTNRAIAAADIHGDGWTDLVVANDTEIGGVSLFANTQGRFQRQEIDLGPEASEFVTTLSLVDWDSDGLPDLFYSTLLGYNGVLLNREGELNRRVELPRTPFGAFTNALGFADLNGDKRLDAVLGTWVHRSMTTQLYRGWNYRLIQSEEGNGNLIPLAGQGGNTNSVLLSDLNSDGYTDLVVANDFAPPDEFYWGGPSGFQLPAGEGAPPACPEWTMTLDSANLHGKDGRALLALNIAFPSDARGRLVEARKQAPEQLLAPDALQAFEYMTATTELHERNLVTQNPRYGLESEILKSADVDDYLYDVVLSRVWRKDSREDWLSYLPDGDLLTRSHFERVFPSEEPAPKKVSSGDSEIPGQRLHSSLFFWTGKDFQDRAKEWGVATTYWSWNARFHDFDLDGLLDLYIVTGSYQEKLLTPNLLFMGKGNSFQRSLEPALADYTPTACSVHFDLDNDGDLDIVTAPANTSLRVFRNNQNDNYAVAISLLDLQGQSAAIGSEISVSIGRTEQTREIKLSGGYASFDPLGKLFGLGSASRVEKWNVRWPDGTGFEGPLPLQAGFQYRVTRKAISD